MNLYLENGYLDIRKIISIDVPFILAFGGRGTGKTYGALETAVEDNLKFMYMRRTQSQADLINTPEFSPFKSLNIDKDWNIGTSTVSKYSAAFYKQEETENKLTNVGTPLGFTCALSTISNMRGFDASDITLFIYDEFIPEKHERPIKNEGAAFFNAYETINRNRELKGHKPLKCLCMSNSNDLANPIFMELNLVRKITEMKRKKQEVYIDKEKGVAVINLEHSPISEKKSKTALYRVTKGSNFAKMSINNDFSGEEMGRINSRPLAEYKPLVVIGEICIYEHKSNRTLYVSTHKTGSPASFGTGDTERARFRRMYQWIWGEYMENNIEFEEYLCEILLTKIFN